MTDDLVKRLRDECEDANDPIFMTRATLLKAADRIEKLEAELVLAKCHWARADRWCATIDCKCLKAREALEGKDE